MVLLSACKKLIFGKKLGIVVLWHKLLGLFVGTSTLFSLPSIRIPVNKTGMTSTMPRTLQGISIFLKPRCAEGGLPRRMAKSTQSRLNLTVSCQDSLTHLPKVFQACLPRVSSNHVHIRLNSGEHSFKPKIFKFDSVWIRGGHKPVN